jgi:antitoxin VapB
MALSIKSEEADRLARELVGLTGETLTTAVTEALRERLQRQRRSGGEDLDALLDRLQEDVAAAPVLDPRADDELIGFDEFGAPA